MSKKYNIDRYGETVYIVGGNTGDTLARPLETLISSPSNRGTVCLGEILETRARSRWLVYELSTTQDNVQGT